MEARKEMCSAIGIPCAPTQLLVLCSLRHHLGRGWTFDDLSESTAISEEVIRVFFHKFIEFGCSSCFEKWVIQPTMVEEAKEQTQEFLLAGLPGAIGSMDSRHILVEKLRFRLSQAHLGFELKGAAHTYNLVVNHGRRILSTTNGPPARCNDKTLVKFDPFIMGSKEGETGTE
jgi:hypothetical protein